MAAHADWCRSNRMGPCNCGRGYLPEPYDGRSDRNFYKETIMPKGSGLTKEMKASEELREIVKHRKVSRGKAVKAIWKYIRKHKLQDKKNRRIINPDKKLAGVLGKKPLDMMKIGGKLTDHLS